MLKSYSRKRSSIDFIKKDLEEFFSSIKISYETFHDIKLSVVELVSNIIKYAKDDDTFMLSVEKEGDIIRISLQYSDMKFDTPESKFKGAAMQESGLGVFLISQLMDRLDYYYNDKTGEVEVKIEKRITT